MANITNRLLNAVMIAGIFVVIGTGATNLITKLIPTSYYYTLENPARTGELNYAPGDLVKVIITRTSRINQAGEETLELSLIGVEGVEVVKTIQRPINIERGHETLVAYFILPDDASAGEYLIRGTIEFRIEGNTRSIGFYTKEFFIKRQ